MRAADECLNELSPLEVCWLTRLSMACAFVHVVDEEDVRHARKPCDDAFSYWSSDECRQVCSGSYVGRNACVELSGKEAIGDYLIYEHGCCGGQRAAMWRHLYGLNNDDAHDYELKYCAERAYSSSGDTKKLTRARVYATTKRAPIIDDVRHDYEVDYCIAPRARLRRQRTKKN